MRPGLWMVGTGGALLPANGRTQDDVRALNLTYGDLVSVQIVEARNPKLNGLVHTVVAKLAEAKGVPFEQMKVWFKYRLGYVDLVRELNGTVKPAPQSWAFDNMDEASFRQFWDHAQTVLAAELLPELEAEERAEIEELLDGKNGQRHDGPKVRTPDSAGAGGARTKGKSRVAMRV